MLEARFLAAGLGDPDSRKRAEAREKLLALGKSAIPALRAALIDSNPNVRWPAAKALSELHHPDTTTDLMNAMEDDDFGVRWLAAQGLIAMGPGNTASGSRIVFRFHPDSGRGAAYPPRAGGQRGWGRVD